MKVLTAFQTLPPLGSSSIATHVITHDGAFHADEVFAIAFLRILYDGKVFVTRTRDTKTLSESIENPNIYVIDVGGKFEPEKNNFDHHQDLNLPSAFGLVYNALGKECFYITDNVYFPDFNYYFKSFVVSIDNWDTNTNNCHQEFEGMSYRCKNTSQIIAGFNRLGGIKEEQETQFFTAVEFAVEILKNEIVECVKLAKDEIGYRNRYVLYNNVAIFDEFNMLWKAKKQHNFAVMPHTSGWQVLARDTAVCTIPETASAFQGFIFRHQGGFIATFKTKEQAIAFAETL